MINHKLTDLACESYEQDKEKNPENGIISSLYDINEYSIIETNITNKIGEELTGRKIGKYLTLYSKNVWKYTEFEQKSVSLALSFCIKKSMKNFCLSKPSFLVVGLGNRQISADALGPMCIDKMTPTHHLKSNKNLYDAFGYDLSLIAPQVLGQSGIESSEIVKNAIKSINPACLILIDSLSTSSLDRLCSTFQVTNTGLTPASAIKEGRGEISSEKMGVPVISIGVPTAISLDALARFFKSENSSFSNIDCKDFLSPKDIDIILPTHSKIIADAITNVIKSM